MGCETIQFGGEMGEKIRWDMVLEADIPPVLRIGAPC